ncbi:MAG: AmmeMemoRadiSam system protein A [Deltaproteobacteria bacterium]|nr:AmmeMemoRadiSam system protein A [Deltaproteobacteria bacterium]
MSSPAESPWTQAQQSVLATLVWRALLFGLRGQRFGRGAPPFDPTQEDWLKPKAATFVTLHRDGALRGCIGTLEPIHPLGESVARNAQSAAFDDPRFAELRAEEWPRLSADISVLSPHAPLSANSMDDLLAKLAPGRDGLVVRARGLGATFLPAVWDDLPQPKAFVDHLWRKAGLPAGAWPADLALATYTADKIACGAAPGQWP